MRQLSGVAAGHLYADTAQANANVSLLHIHDQSTAPGGVVRFKAILAQLERRLHLAPLFRQRLQRVPMAVDHPYWVDDDRFDLEYHLRHIALPKPGDWRQFCIQVSRIHARPLDLERPLWEAYVIEGLDSFLDLPGGSFALMFKTHLAAVDLGTLSELTRLLYDTRAEPPAGPPAAPWFADGAPGSVALLRRGLSRTARTPWRLLRPMARLATQVAPAAVAAAGEALLRPEGLPVTRFNAVVSPHRVFDTRRFAEADFERIRRLVPGASLEDAVLAVCCGALRSYLDDEGELPQTLSLCAVLPPSSAARDSAEPESDEALAWRQVQLGSHLADPVQRLAFLKAQRRAAAGASLRQAKADRSGGASHRASAALLAWSRHWVGQAALRTGTRAPTANCSIAMLPAPKQPLYLCGARMTYTSAILPISDGLGLAFAVTRYDGKVVISPTACRELMPDPEHFAQCLRDSFQAYLALAPQAAKPVPAVKPAAPSASTAGTPRRPRPRA